MRERAAGAGEFVGDGVVVGGRRNDSYVVEILGGGTNHGWSADVDVLDQFFEGHSRLSRGFFEGVEIYDHHVDGGDAVLGDSRYVFGIFAAVQDAAVNLRVQGLDAAVEHLGESGKVGDIFYCDAGVTQEFGGTSGGDEFDAESGERAGEIHESGFVGDTENGALDAG